MFENTYKFNCRYHKVPAPNPCSGGCYSGGGNSAAFAGGQSIGKLREMENKRKGSTFGDFVTEGLMQDVTVAKLQSTRVPYYKLSPPPSFKCKVLRESLPVNSQNIPCATLKRRGSWVISISFGVNSLPLSSNQETILINLTSSCMKSKTVNYSHNIPSKKNKSNFQCCLS